MIEFLYFIEFLVISTLLSFLIFIDIKKFHKIEIKKGMDYQLLIQGIFWKLVFITLSIILFSKQVSFIYFFLYDLIPELYQSILKVIK